MVVEVALARKIQAQIMAIFGMWYKYGQSGTTRQPLQQEYITISSASEMINHHGESASEQQTADLLICHGSRYQDLSLLLHKHKKLNLMMRKWISS